MSLVDSETAKQMCESAKQLLAHGEVDQAIARLQQALIFQPHSPDAKMLIGIAYAQKGMMDEALDALDEAANTSERNPVIHYNYGGVLQKVGRLVEAVAQYEEALRLNPNYDRAKMALEAAKKQWNDPVYQQSVTGRPAARPQPPQEQSGARSGWFGRGKKK
jgi:Tfp pilus assembly protein PilF